MENKCSYYHEYINTEYDLRGFQYLTAYYEYEPKYCPDCGCKNVLRKW